MQVAATQFKQLLRDHQRTLQRLKDGTPADIRTRIASASTTTAHFLPQAMCPPPPSLNQPEAAASSSSNPSPLSEPSPPSIQELLEQDEEGIEEEEDEDHAVSRLLEAQHQAPSDSAPHTDSALTAPKTKTNPPPGLREVPILHTWRQDFEPHLQSIEDFFPTLEEDFQIWLPNRKHRPQPREPPRVLGIYPNKGAVDDMGIQSQDNIPRAYVGPRFLPHPPQSSSADHPNGIPALLTVFVEAKYIFKTGSTERPRAAIALHWGKGHALNMSFTLPGSAKNTVFYERSLTFGAIWAIYQHHSAYLLTSLEILINHPLLITLHNTDGPRWDRDGWKNRFQQALPNADLLRHLYRLLTYLCDHSPTPVTISTIQHSTHTYRTADWAEGRALAKEAVKQQLETIHTLPPNTRKPLKFLKNTFPVSILPENPPRRHSPNVSEVTDTPTWTLEGKLQQAFTRWTHAFYYLNTLERLQVERMGTVGTPLWREAQRMATRLLALASEGANTHIAALPLNQYKLTRWARSVQWEIVHHRVMGLPRLHVEVLGDAADPKHTCPARKEAKPTADEIAEKEQLLTHLGSLIPPNEAKACIPPENANRLQEMVHDLRLQEDIQDHTDNSTSPLQDNTEHGRISRQPMDSIAKRRGHPKKELPPPSMQVPPPPPTATTDTSAASAHPTSKNP
uniref:Uncharacterized protein n=1 Tax=Chromera velia CCMP2878 TaxID=1169474 RepID=A0A0G4HLX4_9ALVE|eukprot:Cvel_28937.t1-p1 / transcript=Cvel_28937.t1 / gene=Cvel_28937 / organism=Chromera_velia_CCMP2878 / gene_product=hypothetical protein / transcript_product=hypothetical protein / location=Cvel_scaffold3877:8798-10831(+) / protein_length=678 / sequence_SO=supercontig / SO=protein_coding / is_pseudo=false